MPGLIAYAQIAKGFLAPPLNVLQTTEPQNLNPQETWNYQTGLTWQTDKFTVSGDLYYIDFSNRIATQTIDGTAIYSNGGGAIYQGLELEGTYKLTYGVSMYANGTINEGYYKNPTAAGTGKQLATTPNRTAAIGPIIDANGFSAALLAKYIGKQYGQDTPVDAYPIKAYQTADFVMGYTLPIPDQRKIDFRLSINNIFDSHAVTFFNGASSGPGAPGLFFTLPGRSVFFSAAAHI
jgi:iron complex outermembrane receptor protein